MCVCVWGHHLIKEKKLFRLPSASKEGNRSLIFLSFIAIARISFLFRAMPSWCTSSYRYRKLSCQQKNTAPFECSRIEKFNLDMISRSIVMQWNQNKFQLRYPSKFPTIFILISMNVHFTIYFLLIALPAFNIHITQHTAHYTHSRMCAM